MLDDIIDIFISQGWAGFCKIVLAILQKLQFLLIKMNYEEILILLSELSKNNFQFFEDKQIRINFKTEILKFEEVDDELLEFYEGAYFGIKKKLDRFWKKFKGAKEGGKGVAIQSSR